MVWKRALEREPEIPNPDGHGWKTVSGELHYVWMEKKAAPEAIFEMMECKYTQICEGNCPCSAFGLKCTDLCRCEGNCNNSTEEFDEKEFGETEDDSDDDDEDDGNDSDEDISECESEQDNDTIIEMLN